MNIKELLDNYFRKSNKMDMDEIAPLFLQDENEEELENVAWDHWKEPVEQKVNLEHILKNIQEKEIRTPVVIPAGKRWLYNYYRIAGVLLIPIFLILSYTLIFTGDHRNSAVSNVEMATLAGQRCRFELSDGTKVWLNSESKLEYPQKFSGKNRKVLLTGEGYFEVAHNKDWPFIVETPKLAVKAVGTSFNVRAYSDIRNVEVTLVTGKVILSGSQKNDAAFGTLALNPGQCFNINWNTGEKSLVKVDPERFISWKDGILCFRDDPLSMVAERLSRWYNINMVIADKELNKIKYTATYTTESPDQILSMMKMVLPVDISVSERVLNPDGTLQKQTVTLSRKGGGK